MKRTELELPPGPNLRYVEDPYLAATDADALLILTDWTEFCELDLKRLYTLMRYPIVLDGRNLFEPKDMHELGFTYISVGRPAVYPTRDVEVAIPAGV